MYCNKFTTMPNPNNTTITVDNVTIRNSRGGNRFKQWCQRFLLNISVEPTIFLFMMAYMITSVIEHSFYVFQACTIDHGFKAEECYNISANTELNLLVQPTVNSFNQWNGIAKHVAPSILAMFIGAYSDKRGRKVIILMGLFGKLFYSLMLVFVSVAGLPLKYKIYLATIPSSFTGSDLAIFTGCFSYVSDITSPTVRTLRIGLVHITYMLTLPLGPAIGRYIWSLLPEGSYTLMFSINAALVFISIVYTILRLDWYTASSQSLVHNTNPIREFFNWSNITDTLNTLVSKRFPGDRLKLWLAMMAMVFYVIPREESSVMYLYTTNVFRWGVHDYSHYMTFTRGLSAVTLVVLMPILTKWFQWRDSLIAMIGALSFAAGHVVFVHATTSKYMFIGSAVGVLGACVSPVLRSITTKIVDSNEIGSACALLNVMENLIGIVAAIVYSQAYKSLLGTPELSKIFYVTVTSEMCVFCVLVIMEMPNLIKWLAKSTRSNDKDVENNVVLTFASSSSCSTEQKKQCETML